MSMVSYLADRLNETKAELAAERAAREKAEAKVARLREALERLLAAEDSGMGVIGWEDAVGNARAAMKDTDG